jgi:hypothetical protein
MDTDIPTTNASSDGVLHITNPIRAALCLASGARFGGYVTAAGSKMLTFKLIDAPKDFTHRHETGQLMVETDRMEREHGYITGVIREHSRTMEIQARANRSALGALSQRR